MRIAVLGSASSSLPKAPFQNQAYAEWAQGKIPSVAKAHAEIGGEWDIWACSPGCWAVIPRATRFFEVHRAEPGKPWFSPEYWQFLRDFKGTLYTGGTIPEFPNHVVYPIDRMEEKFSSYNMTSSLALMMALAIDVIEFIRENRKRRKEGLPMLAPTPDQGPIDEAEYDKDDSDDIIGMWGVDMAAAEEYARQRPGCQNFVIEAMRRGIGVYLPPESDLMRPEPVYGISEWDHNYIKLTSRARELNALHQSKQAILAEESRMIPAIQGEIAALQAFVNTWVSPYGMQHGVVVRQAPGTGLGGGITHLDTRPISRMTVGEEPTAVPPVPIIVDSKHSEVLNLLETYKAATGYVSEPAELVKRMAEESDTARAHARMLQHLVKPGESTTEAIVRLLGPKAKRKR